DGLADAARGSRYDRGASVEPNEHGPSLTHDEIRLNWNGDGGALPHPPCGSTSAVLRPLVSPRRPITMPPSGRATQPTPKAAKAASREAVGSVPGKNFAAIREAR